MPSLSTSMNNRLYAHPLFGVRVESMEPDHRVLLSYQRAQAVLRAYKLTATDVLKCSKKFWDLQMDPVMAQDMACFTIIAANQLVTGTIAGHIRERPDLVPLLESLLRLEAVGVYLLTERGHGLDAFNIETTARKTNGGFILNTPNEQASKFMPATTPSGMPKFALVVAKLSVGQEDFGSRTFIVPICDDKEMYSGVSSTRLPPRSGTTPLDFSITTFNNVYLPDSALLGPILRTSSTSSRELWWNEVSRIPIGTFAIAAPLVQAIKQVAYIGGKYSFRRKIAGKDQTPTPIISFRTQQWPVLQAVAIGKILETWYPINAQLLSDPRVDGRIKHAMAVIFKTTVCRHFQICVHQVMERCGAQGTFEHNWMSRMEADARGAVIAEGDVLTLCIRLFSELILGRYEIPLPQDNSSLLVKHAKGFLETATTLASKLPGGHRGESFNSLILPQAELGVASIGHAIAYSSAMAAGVHQPLLDLYECAVMRLDPVWYSEVAQISAQEQRLKEHQAISKALPYLQEYLSSLGAEHYVSAPIVDDGKWLKWVSALPSFEGNAKSEPLDVLSMAHL